MRSLQQLVSLQTNFLAQQAMPALPQVQGGVPTVQPSAALSHHSGQSHLSVPVVDRSHSHTPIVAGITPVAPVVTADRPFSQISTKQQNVITNHMTKNINAVAAEFRKNFQAKNRTKLASKCWMSIDGNIN